VIGQLFSRTTLNQPDSQINLAAKATTILQLDRGHYVEVGQFASNDPIQSPQLAELVAITLTVGRLLDAVK
jgi:hypothetical protein